MDGSEFEKFCRIKGLHPVKKITDPKADIFVAETDWMNDNPREFPWGYYQTVWAVAGKASKGKIDVARWLNFDVMHDKEKNLSIEGKKQARINAAVEDARGFVHENLKVARYG